MPIRADISTTTTDRRHPPPVTILPIFWFLPERDSGMPVARETRLFIALMPSNRFHEMEYYSIDFDGAIYWITGIRLLDPPNATSD